MVSCNAQPRCLSAKLRSNEPFDGTAIGKIVSSVYHAPISHTGEMMMLIEPVE